MIPGQKQSRNFPISICNQGWPCKEGLSGEEGELKSPTGGTQVSVLEARALMLGGEGLSEH